MPLPTPLPLPLRDVETEAEAEVADGVLVGDFGVFAAVVADAVPHVPPELMGANTNAPGSADDDEDDDDEDGAAAKHKWPAHRRSMRARARDTSAAA
jgi:hypothetical protein